MLNTMPKVLKVIGTLDESPFISAFIIGVKINVEMPSILRTTPDANPFFSGHHFCTQEVDVT